MGPKSTTTPECVPDRFNRCLDGAETVILTWAHNPAAVIGCLICIFLLFAWVAARPSSPADDSKE